MIVGSESKGVRLSPPDAMLLRSGPGARLTFTRAVDIGHHASLPAWRRTALCTRIRPAEAGRGRLSNSKLLGSPSHRLLVPTVRLFSTCSVRFQDEGKSDDPRIRDLGRKIADDFAFIRDNYAKPKHPIVLAHGLLGFSELRLAGDMLPGIRYWHGIQEALEARGIRVLTTSVPPSGSIEDRAAALRDSILEQVGPGSDGQETTVNIIAHSMGGLDARYMISRLPPDPHVRVASLVTVATPHHGSSYADHLLDEILGPTRAEQAYSLFKRATGFPSTAAFAQLTNRFAAEFNPITPDRDDVRYYSYGAMLRRPPPLLSPFRRSWRLLEGREGPNDGLVSVESSQWGVYKGTLVDVNHLDLINWTNRLRWTVKRWLGVKRTFNAIALYLDIADMLAKEGH